MAETLNSQIDLVLGNVPIITDDLTPQELWEALLKLHQAIEILVAYYDYSSGLYVDLANAQTIAGAKTFSSDLTFAAGSNIVANAVTGTKIGTATNQKLALWNKTPIIQPAAANQSALTNNTTGARDGVLANTTGTVDVTTAADGAVTNNNFTDIYALITEIRTALVNTGVMKGSA